jgi:hypothetical protein
MTLRAQQGKGNGKRKHYIALCGELSLEGDMDLRKTDYRINQLVIIYLKLYF